LALPAAQPTDPAKAAAELKTLNERIQRLTRQQRQDTVEKDKLSRALRDAERAASKAQGELARLRSERGERVAARKKLEAERAEHEAQRRRTEEDLEKQLRAAYFMGRNEPLKLLLNQRSPGEFSRNLTYYGYVGRLRADQMRQIAEEVAKIEELTAEIEAEEQRLAALEAEQKQRVAELDRAR